MKVVMIGPFAFKPKGTVSSRAFFMARALAKQGHQVTIVMPPYDHLEDSDRKWVQDGVTLENMRMRRNDTWHQIVVPVRMARRVARLRPDVVHIFKPIGYSGLSGAYLRCLTGYPLILDTDDWEGTGGWNDANPYPSLWRWLFDQQERWLARRADAVTVVSRTLQTQVWGMGVDPVRVLYLPNGPDVRLRDLPEVGEEKKAAVRRRLGVGNAPLALYLGTIPHGTDLDLAVDAMAQLRPRLPTARLVIAGVGDGLPALRAHAAAAGVPDLVEFPGWIEHEHAHVYWAAADVAVNPYRDSLINRAKCAGKVVLAMAMGRAVITSRLGENREYIEHLKSGMLTIPGDVDDLASTLYKVLSNRSLAAELGRNARRHIWANYDWDARIQEVERTYKSARARRTSSPTR